jgi:hypothetical protein
MYLGIGVTKLNGNVAFQLILESDSLKTIRIYAHRIVINYLDTRNGLYNSRLTVSDVTNRTYKCQGSSQQDHSQYQY